MTRILKYTFLVLFLFVTLRGIKIAVWDIPRLRWTNPTETSLMQERGGPIRQVWVPLSKISRLLRQFVVAAEDSRFYQHHGVDLEEMEETIKKDWKAKRFVRGGSTITMQLAKNLYLFSGKNIFRKIFEIPLALKMETNLTKERILEIYLNVIEWGDGIYGAEAASHYYFQKSASDLNVREAAFLVAIIPNPRRFGHWPPGGRIQKRMALIETRGGSRERLVFEDRLLKKGEEKKIEEQKHPEEEQPLPDELFLDED